MTAASERPSLGPAGAAGNGHAASCVAPAVVEPITEQERGAYFLARYGKSGRERALFIRMSRAEQDAEIRKARKVTPAAEAPDVPEPSPQAIPSDPSSHTPLPVILRSEAAKHLAALSGRTPLTAPDGGNISDLKAFTFQTFADIEVKDGRRLVRVLHGSLNQHFETLAALNDAGAGIYITVNQTDGKGRTAQNITHVRAQFADLDGAPIEPVLAWSLKPRIVIESSPGKYHAYWLVTKEASTDFDGFRERQRQLVKLFNADPKCIDLPRVLRLAGFNHRKAEPFRCRILKEFV
jgi:RepB DNA-primase from phage plasmid